MNDKFDMKENNELTNNTETETSPSEVNETAQPAEPSVEYRYTWNQDESKKAEEKKKRSETRRLRIFATVMSLLTVLSVSAMIMMLAYGGAPKIPAEGNQISNVSSESADNTSFPSYNAFLTNGGDNLSLQEIAEKMDKSTVTVYCTGAESPFGGRSISFGSGFVISENGYVVTNHHVIDEAESIKVIFYDDSEYEATLVGGDSLYDIAVLKIEGDNFIPAVLGSSDELVVGDMVVAIGTPYSLDLAGTHTFGFISATDRQVAVTSGSSVIKTMTMLQTDATLNSGNSGGPLVNMKGQVIGINTMKLVADYEGIGFAIPMSSAIDIINQLIEKGTVTDPNDSVTASPYLGVQVSNVTEEEAQLYNVPMGALVTYIETSGSAYKAGMRRNDIITKFDGVKVESVDDLVNELGKHKVGDTVNVEVFRNEETVTITFKLDPRSE
ncbi:MAG: trypsin-like peptidase domain-containing protein [Eubacteriales bacterium]|nr:trypsin-like peptidase domain-containing protein [Eubacteriales bacterium]MDD4475436.1 trypsin-like peptidase domain-containing protein [Eubacteriales bacterium]